ncbi:MAG: methyltransferase domain-containing protein [Acidobacteriota bacterium]
MGRSPAIGFERVDAAARPQGLAAYLELVNELPAVRAYRERMEQALDLPAGHRVLDVGCGTGAESARLAASGLRAVGADLSIDLLAAARRQRKSGSEGLPVFTAGNALALPFANAAFDGCRAERVLQHVTDPAAAVAELMRVCRPGRRVVVSEPDWGTLAVDIDDAALARKVLAAACDLVPQGWIGRRLPGLCRDAGLQDVTIEAHSLVVEGYATADALFGVASGPLRALDADRLPPEDVARWLGALDRREQRGPLLASLTGLTASGRVPDR